MLHTQGGSLQDVGGVALKTSGGSDPIMPCQHSGPLTLCRPTTRWAMVRREWCPTCTRRTPFATLDRGEWYAPHSTCLRCGDAWAGEDLLPRLKPRWRAKAIAEARRQVRACWAAGGAHHPILPDDHADG